MRVQGGPSFLRRLVMPSHLTLTFMDFLPNIEILRQVGVRQLLAKHSPTKAPKSTHTVR